MKKQDLESLTLTRISSSNLMKLSEWKTEQRQRGMIKDRKLLKATKPRKLWISMITHIQKRYST